MVDQDSNITMTPQFSRRRLLAAGSSIGLMGEQGLCDLYAPALSLRGLKVEEADAEQAVIAGLTSLYAARA